MSQWRRHKHSNLVLATSILKIPSPTLLASINTFPSPLSPESSRQIHCLLLLPLLPSLLPSLSFPQTPPAGALPRHCSSGSLNNSVPYSHICSFHFIFTKQNEILLLSNPLPASPVHGFSLFLLA